MVHYRIQIKFQPSHSAIIRRFQVWDQKKFIQPAINDADVCSHGVHSERQKLSRSIWWHLAKQTHVVDFIDTL
jgi:hypothetical protein